MIWVKIYYLRIIIFFGKTVKHLNCVIFFFGNISLIRVRKIASRVRFVHDLISLFLKNYGIYYLNFLTLQLRPKNYNFAFISIIFDIIINILLLLIWSINIILLLTIKTLGQFDVDQNIVEIIFKQNIFKAQRNFL